MFNAAHININYYFSKANRGPNAKLSLIEYVIFSTPNPTRSKGQVYP